jgi:DNA-binding transcriptional MerR regulator
MKRKGKPMLADLVNFEDFKLKQGPDTDSDQAPELREVAESFDVDAPLFRARHLCQLAGITFQTLMNWQVRELIHLLASEQDTEGRRRKYPATDAIRVKVVKELVDVGLPFASANYLAQDAVTRLKNLINGGPGHGRESMIFILGKTEGEWCALPYYADGKSEEPAGIPPVFVVVNVDELLEQTIQQLRVLPKIKTTSFAPTGYKGPRPGDEMEG